MESPRTYRKSTDEGSRTPTSARYSSEFQDAFRSKSSYSRSSAANQADKSQEEAYFSDLLSYSLERLGKEPDILQAEREQLKRQSQDAAIQHYKGFIEVSKCLIALRDQVSLISQNLEVLQEGLPQMDQACEDFVQGAQAHAGKRTQNKQLLRQQGVLTEILEVPALMDTCLRSGNYDDVLDLRAFVSKLTLLHPDLPVVKSLVEDSEKISREMLEALLSRLRTNIQLPECLRVVAHLRRLNVFSEARLRQTFLQCREEWLSGLVVMLDESNAYDYLKRLTDVHRLQLFDVVMQFRAIFSDEITSDGHDDESAYDGGAIFTWAEYRVMLYIEAVAKYLPRIKEGGGLASVLEHCMYCGMSLGRVGLDFRGLLSPIFETCILGLFTSFIQTAVQACVSMLESHTLSSAQSSRRSKQFAQPPHKPSQSKEGGPPYSLMEHPPLAVLVNGILTALNELRHCAPLSIQARLASVLQEALQGVKTVLNGVTGLEHRENDGTSALDDLLQAFDTVVCPYVSKSFLKLYAEKGPGLDLNGLTRIK